MATFKEAFAAARKEKGAGKTFTWNGKSYTTDMATDKKQSAPTASDKPKAKPAVSGASRSTAGKVAPKASMEQQKAAYGANRPATMGNAAKMSQTDRAMAEAKAAKAAKDAKAKSKKTVAPAATSAKPKALTPFQRLGNIVAGGGFSNYLKKK